MDIKRMHDMMFESSVNSEGIETKEISTSEEAKFESSVNSEGIETITLGSLMRICLRVV